MLDDANPPFYRWFTDGRINASYNCLDRHVEAGRGDRVAFHWHGEEGMTRAVTYADLLRDVERLANALKDRGVGKGDIVGIYLPMIPEVVVAMLACARIGEQVDGMEGGIGLQVQLVAVDPPYPGPLRRQLAADEHDRAVLAACR